MNANDLRNDELSSARNVQYAVDLFDENVHSICIEWLLDKWMTK